MTFDKDKLESLQVYSDDMVGNLKELNKGLDRIERMIDEIQEKKLEAKYEN